jgi:hypothetical protein
MSTKIYNAYRFTGTIQQLVPRLKRYRDQVIEEFVDILGSNLPFDLPNRGALRQQLREKIDQGQIDDLNFQSSIVVYVPPKIDCYLLVQIFGLDFYGNNRIKARLPRGLKDWHYQNSCDKPDDVSKTEWEARKKIWGLIFKDTHTPSKAGLIMPIIEKSNVDDLIWKLYDKRKAAGTLIVEGRKVE